MLAMALSWTVSGFEGNLKGYVCAAGTTYIPSLRLQSLYVVARQLILGYLRVHVKDR